MDAETVRIKGKAAMSKSALFALLIIPAWNWSPSVLQAQMQTIAIPAHKVASNTSLTPKCGRRIEIHTNKIDLTKDECRALIRLYRPQAAPDGQVSVRKPSKKLGGQMLPWCVENLRGDGITFNDMFD